MTRLVRFLRCAVLDQVERIRRRPRRRKFYRGPVRSKKYKAWIRTLPSAVSGRMGCEAAHVGHDGGMRQKASDTTCVPLTPAEHREYHQIGRKDFEKKYGIDLDLVAEALFQTWCSLQAARRARKGKVL